MGREVCILDSTSDIVVAAFYCFAPQDGLAGHRSRLRELTDSLGVRGTILLASEGINGTIAGTAAALHTIRTEMERMTLGYRLSWRESAADEIPFRRMKVRLKREIVTLGQQEADPNQVVGEYVEPEDWDGLIKRDDVIVIDTRNDYETAIGSFAGAIDPKTSSFGEFPQWWDAHAREFEGKTIAMFCTGGIRCEKATSWLKARGTPDVVHLKGGILAYLATRPVDGTTWQGECFVFDERVALGHRLKKGVHRMCPQCGHPVHQSEDVCRRCTATAPY